MYLIRACFQKVTDPISNLLISGARSSAADWISLRAHPAVSRYIAEGQEFKYILGVLHRNQSPWNFFRCLIKSAEMETHLLLYTKIYNTRKNYFEVNQNNRKILKPAAIRFSWIEKAEWRIWQHSWRVADWEVLCNSFTSFIYSWNELPFLWYLQVWASLMASARYNNNPP